MTDLSRPNLPGRTIPGMNQYVCVPEYVAYCGIRRALRSFRRKGSRFIAVLILTGDMDAAAYECGAQLLLKHLANEDISWHNSDYARFIDNPTNMATFLTTLASRDSFLRAMVILNDRSLLTPDLTLAADIIVSVDPPRPEHFVAAARLIHCYRPLDSELLFLMCQPFNRQRIAFRDKHSFSEGVRRLAKLEATDPAVAGPSSREIDAGPTLADLHGYGEAETWGYELAADVADFRSGKLDWKNVHRGALIVGPPGTGKTMFVHALARTCELPVIVTSAGVWQEAGFLNDHLRAMSDTFVKAKAAAPSILFIDEVDAVGSRTRTHDHNSDYSRQIISRLLILIDEVGRDSQVVVVGACNFPGLLDPAIKRAGRLDRRLDIPLPDAIARAAILTYHSELELKGEELWSFMTRSPGMSGSDIERLVRDAKREARRRSDDLTPNDILQRLPGLIRLSASKVRLAAIHEIGHAIVALNMPHTTVEAVNINDELLRSGNPEMAGSATISIDETAHRDRQYYLDLIAVDLAGIAAECAVLGKFSDGAGGDEQADLVRATYRASLAEAVFGFGETLTSIPTREESDLRRLRLQDRRLNRAVQEILRQQLDRATAIIIDNRSAVDALVENLVREKRLSARTVMEVYEEHGGTIAMRPGWLSAVSTDTKSSISTASVTVLAHLLQHCTSFVADQ